MEKKFSEIVDVLKLDNLQIYNLLLGYENGIDISKFNNPKLSYMHMRVCRIALENGIDISDNIKEFNNNQLNKILLGLDDNIDIKIYADPKFDHRQMDEIRMGLRDKLDVSTYTKSEISHKEMKKIRETLFIEKYGYLY